MGDPVAATRRLPGLQEVLANEIADEAGGLGEAKSVGKRDAAGNRKCERIGYSDDPVRAFWYSFGYSRVKNRGTEWRSSRKVL